MIEFERCVTEAEPTPAKPPPVNPFFKPALPTHQGPRIEFPLPNNNSIEIRLKKPVSKKDFERIKKLVELSEASLVEEKRLGSDLKGGAQ